MNGSIPRLSPSKPEPNPEGTRVPPPLSPVDPAWAMKSGLLHVLNEATLWPLGFAIVVGQSPDGTIGLVLMEAGEPIVPEIPAGDHRAAHSAFVQMLAHRFQPQESLPDEMAAARRRLVLPLGTGR